MISLSWRSVSGALLNHAGPTTSMVPEAPFILTEIAAQAVGQHLTGSSALHVLVAASDGIILECNRAFRATLGFGGEPVIGSSLWDRMPKPDREALRTEIAEGVSGGRKRILFLDAAASQIPLECTWCAAPESLSIVGEAVKPPSDQIANLKDKLAAALENLRETETLLLHRDKLAMLGSMAAGIVHELNTPVAYLLSNQHTLKADFRDLLGVTEFVRTSLPEIEDRCPETGPTIRKMLARIDSVHLTSSVPQKLDENIAGLERLAQTARDLRNHARLDEAEWKTVDLKESLGFTLRMLSHIAATLNVRIEADYGSVGSVYCAPVALNQAVSNILLNAVQASPPGELVRVSTAGNADAWSITVEDRGAGIPAENLGRIFDPFFTTKPAGEGTGIGLSIAQRAVAANGGRIEIESRPDHGTRVTIAIQTGAPNVA